MTEKPKKPKILMKLRSINKYLICDIKKKECELLNYPEPKYLEPFMYSLALSKDKD